MPYLKITLEISYMTKNHLYGIPLIHFTWSTELKHENTFRQPDIEFYWQNFETMSASLTTVTRLETKQSSTHPSFYEKRIHSPVPFWGSDKCGLSAPCLSFHLKLGCSFLFHAAKLYWAVISTLCLSNIFRCHNII